MQCFSDEFFKSTQNRSGSATNVTAASGQNPTYRPALLMLLFLLLLLLLLLLPLLDFSCFVKPRRVIPVRLGRKGRENAKQSGTTGGQGPGKADNWRARSRDGGQLAGRFQGRRTTGMQGLGKVDNWRVKTESTQKRRTTGGQGPGKAEHWWAGPGKADNWRARSREGGQPVGRVQGRRTTGAMSSPINSYCQVSRH